jgi:hypothetical protein
MNKYLFEGAFMKKNVLVFMFFLISLLVSCASVEILQWDDSHISPNKTQSVLIFKRTGNGSYPVEITINDQRGMFRNNLERKIIPNGTHTIILFPPNSSRLLYRKEITINTNHEQITILLETHNSTFKIKLLSKENLEEVRITRIREEEIKRLEEEEDRGRIRADLLKELKIVYPGIEGAVARAGQSMVNTLPKGLTVAVINIRSKDGGMSDYIAVDLESQLFNAGFTVVERKELDIILAEQKLQMSGSVSDESAVSIGKMFGVRIILTGMVSEVGSNRRLSIRAMDVETAKIVTMILEDF